MAPITRSMKRRHEESQREALNRFGRFNLKGLNQDIQLHILKSMEEADIKTLISISTPLKHLFAKYEHEFPPPAALADREMITFFSSEDVKGGRLRMIYKWNDRRRESFLEDLSFSQLRRYLQTAKEIRIDLHDSLPEYFRRGTVAYAELKAYIRGHCDIEVAFFYCRNAYNYLESGYLKFIDIIFDDDESLHRIVGLDQWKRAEFITVWNIYGIRQIDISLHNHVELGTMTVSRDSLRSAIEEMLLPTTIEKTLYQLLRTRKLSQDM